MRGGGRPHVGGQVTGDEGPLQQPQHLRAPDPGPARVDVPLLDQARGSPRQNVVLQRSGHLSTRTVRSWRGRPVSGRAVRMRCSARTPSSTTADASAALLRKWKVRAPSVTPAPAQMWLSAVPS